MKLNILSKFLATSIVCLFLFSPCLSAQDKDPKIKDSKSKDLRALFMEMYNTAKLTNPKAKKPCYADALSIFNTIDKKKLLPSSKDNYKLSSYLEFDFKKINKDLDKVPIDQKFFPTKVDRLMDDYEKIVAVINDEPVINDEGFKHEFLDDLMEKSGGNFDKYQKSAKTGLKSLIASISDRFPIGGEHSFKQKQCKISIRSSISPIKLSYPKMHWQIETSIAIQCGCSENNAEKVKYAGWLYTADIEGVFTASEQNFKHSRVTNPKLREEVSCCPEKKEEETSGASFIPEAQDLIVNDDPPLIRLPSGFTLGAQLGVPIGDEADFFGLTYGAEVGYFHSLSKKFEIGATTGYTYYTSIKTDFGFETEGEGFIPITAKGAYNFSESFGVEAGLGYAVSTGGGEGGFIYSIGPVWRPLQNFSVLLGYVNIAFGEGSLGAYILTGRISLQKKQKK